MESVGRVMCRPSLDFMASLETKLGGVIRKLFQEGRRQVICPPVWDYPFYSLSFKERHLNGYFLSLLIMLIYINASPTRKRT